MIFFGNKDAARRSSRGKRNRSGGSILSLWIEVFAFLVLAFLLYVLASIFSLRTGAWGEEIRFSLLRNWGGAVIIPVLFGGYLCVSYLLKTGAGGIIRQFLGTVLLFFCSALLFGLFRMAAVFQGVAVLSPGYLGDGLAIFFTRNIGSLGTLLLGAALLVLSASLYGFFQPAAVIRKVSLLVKTISSEKWKRMPFPADDVRGPSPVSAEQEMAPEAYPEGNRTSRPWSFSSPAEQEESGIIPPPGAERTGEAASLPQDGTEDLAGDDDDFFLRKLGRETETTSSEPPADRLPVAFGGGEGRPSNNEEETEEREDERDPHALPEIEFNELEGTEKKVRGAAFPPPLDIFGPKQLLDSQESNETVREQAASIIATLADFGVSAEMADVVIGPTVIQFQMQLAPGIKVSKVASLSNDLAVALTVPSLRIEAPIPGKPYVGVEIPNPKRRGISIRTILESKIFQDNEYDLPLPMGVRVDSRPLVVGLEDLPHLLVAGTTGSGKSVFVTSCITGLCSYRSPEELRLILIDPKRVEMSMYENLPHVLAKPVVSPKKAVQALAWAVREMEHRYEIFARARVRNLKSYNQCVLPKAQLPYIVIVVDELADLMFTAQKEVEDYICRLAQMARATGIHLILATQRPSVNVITGLIKANVPARVAFTLPSQTDSRTIIDISGAERLLGKGDMLFVSSRYPRPLRVQSPFIDDGKSIEIINYLRNVFGDPEYVDIEDQGGDAPSGGDTSYADDPLLEEAVDIVLGTGIASASRLQRQLRVGFTRAARLIDTMEQIGIVGPPEGSKPREIMVDDERAREMLRSASGQGD
ncbi:DNA translocase FtsK [Aminivibrio sp.]|uniref:FtsK/SpoIIIE family DNA translocase n=1 Tax=Aminivibrio sp. TaxID=1872489 RepID=UPI0025BAFE00|nr:DNA translocase FtsK [Aminivibrio sp.]